MKLSEFIVDDIIHATVQTTTKDIEDWDWLVYLVL